MRHVQRTIALIPAAGKSKRMGKQKLALPLGDKTVLDWVIEAFTAAGVDHVLVITAPHNEELLAIVESTSAGYLLLGEQTPDMRTTVLRGLEFVENEFDPHDGDCWFLSPADHPTIRPHVIEQLLEAWQRHENATIFIPTCNGKRGHPALVGWQHVAGMRQLAPDQGLNSYFRERQSEVLEWPGFSDDVLIDLDTPEDYESLFERWKN